MKISLPPLPMQFIVDVDVEAVERLAGQEHDRVLFALRSAAFLAGQWIRGVWTRVAQGVDARRTGAYIRGIQDNGIVRIVSSGENHAEEFEVVVEVVNTAPHASFVEEGHSAFHLPSVINWGATGGRIKRTKDGVPYMHIPFRHRAYADAAAREEQGLTSATRRAMMPEHIYHAAKKLTFTQSLGVGPIHSPSGQFIQADRYKWGTRLDRSGSTPRFIMGGHGVGAGGPGEPGYEEHRSARVVGRDANGNPLLNPAWQNSKYHGMFRSGSRGHSSYMTIRTITADSKGWNIPAQQGLFIAEKVARHAEGSEELRGIIEAAVGAALGVR